MSRVAIGLILALALAGCAAGAPPPAAPVAADPMSCTGDRFREGIKSYASCIRRVASPSPPRRAARAVSAELILDGRSANRG